MWEKVKNYLLVISLVLLSSFSFIVYFLYKDKIILKQEKEAIEKQVVAQKELVDNITRSMSQYSTKKDLEEYIKQSNVNYKAIKEDLDKIDGKIVASNKVVVVSTGVKQDNISSTGSIPNGESKDPPQVDCNGTKITCPDVDKYKHLSNKRFFDLEEQFGSLLVPFGRVTFDASKEKPWGKDIKSREYKLSTVVGMDENQRHYFYNKLTITVDNKDYDLKISKAESKEEFPKPKFSAFNPRLFLGISGGINIKEIQGTFSPNLSVGLMSYGKFKNQPDFIFLQLGVGYNTVSKNTGLFFNPFSYNLGNHIPLIKNTYIGPSLQIHQNKNINILGTISAGL